MLTEPTDRGARLVALAMAFVDSGRFAAGLTVDESGRGRSWWWPMPGASDRPTLLALLDGEDFNAPVVWPTSWPSS